MKNAGRTRSNAPPAPSWSTGATSDPAFLDWCAPLPLPGESAMDHLRRISRHTREVETLGVRARQGDFRFTHTNRHFTRGPKRSRGPNKAPLLQGDGKGRGRPRKHADSTSAADSRAPQEQV
jgi:hypothetical protein